MLNEKQSYILFLIYIVCCQFFSLPNKTKQDVQRYAYILINNYYNLVTKDN